MQRITTFLWFNGQAEEAMNHYVSIFKNSKILNMNRMGGDVLVGTFEIEGQQFMVLNGGPPHATFTDAISLYVNCETQAEVDHLWDKLLEGGTPSQCGWLKDKFGLSWQIIPSALTRLMGDKDPAKAQRVMQAMMQMVKIDIQKLQDAYDNE